MWVVRHGGFQHMLNICIEHMCYNSYISLANETEFVDTCLWWCFAAIKAVAL